MRRLRIAFVARDLHEHGGPPSCAAALIQRVCEEHDVTVFCHAMEGIDAHNVNYYRVPAVSGTWLLDRIVFLICSTLVFAFLRLIRRKKYDIVHAVTGFPFFFANVTTSHFCEREALSLERDGTLRAPSSTIIGTLRGLDHALYRRFQAFLEKLTLGRGRPSVRIAVSRRVKDDLRRHYGRAAEDVLVIPNGVDCNRFNPGNRALYRDEVRRQHEIPPQAPLLLFVGGDWERKGLACLIKALSLMHRRDVRLLVVGNGDVEAYRSFARGVQVEDRVVFVPHTREVEQYYAACDVFAFPTLYEPFGLVILEAMASGVPVVTSRLAGATDYITDGVSGVLLDDPQNVGELASRIDLLLSDGELRAEMGKHGRRVAEGLSWDVAARNTMLIYEAAAGSRQQHEPDMGHRVARRRSGRTSCVSDNAARAVYPTSRNSYRHDIRRNGYP